MNIGRSLVSPKRVTLILVLVVLCLTILGIVSSFVADSQCRFFIDMKGNIIGAKARRILMEGPFVRLFDLNKEGNIPTFYSTFALLLSSTLLAVIAFAKKKENVPYSLHWKALSIIFLFMSLDEAVSLHEMTTLPLLSALKSSGFQYNRLPPGMDGNLWVILGALFLLVFVLVYLRFLADLPQKTRNLFLVAGALFVGGAIGMELIGGYYMSLFFGQSSTLSRFCNIKLNYQMITTVEELLEMLGIVVFIYALMSYISLHVKEWLTLIK